MVVVELAHMSQGYSAGQMPAADESVWWRMVSVSPDITTERFRRFSGVQRAVAEKTGATFVPAGAFGITGASNYCPGDPIPLNRAGAERMGTKLNFCSPVAY